MASQIGWESTIEIVKEKRKTSKKNLINSLNSQTIFASTSLRTSWLNWPKHKKKEKNHLYILLCFRCQISHALNENFSYMLQRVTKFLTLQQLNALLGGVQLAKLCCDSRESKLIRRDENWTSLSARHKTNKNRNRQNIFPSIRHLINANLIIQRVSLSFIIIQLNNA